jgi:hypothetical protein
MFQNFICLEWFKLVIQLPIEAKVLEIRDVSDNPGIRRELLGVSKGEVRSKKEKGKSVK